MYNYTYEFSNILEELYYLKLFDRQFYNSFGKPAMVELMCAVRIVTGVYDTDMKTIKKCLNEAGKLRRVGAWQEFHLSKQADRKEFLGELHRVEVELQEASNRLGAFVKENFKIWELFSVRKELKK